MSTAADLLDTMAKARDQLRAAEREEAEARKVLRAAQEKLKAANKRYAAAIDEALDEKKRPGLPFDEAAAEVQPVRPVAVADTRPVPGPPVVRLSDVPNFPDAVFDALFAQGVSTVPTLTERVDEATRGIDLPLRNRIVTYLVKLKVKLKPAENAADAVAAHVGATPGGTSFTSIPGFPAAALGPLAEEGVRTVEDLDAKVAEMRTKSAHREATRYSALRSLGLGEALVLAVGDKLVDHFAPNRPEPAKIIDALNLPKPKRTRKPKAVAQ